MRGNRVFGAKPRGESVSYLTGRPNIRLIKQQIRALGYEVWDLIVDLPGFQRQQIPRGVWLHAVVLSK